MCLVLETSRKDRSTFLSGHDTKRRTSWPSLELQNVNKGFGPPSNRYEVLKNVNLTIEKNEFVAVIGFSGSGKSTLMSLLAGLEQPDSGSVVLMKAKPVTEPGPERGHHVPELLAAALAVGRGTSRSR